MRISGSRNAATEKASLYMCARQLAQPGQQPPHHTHTHSKVTLPGALSSLTTSSYQFLHHAATLCRSHLPSLQDLYALLVWFPFNNLLHNTWSSSSRSALRSHRLPGGLRAIAYQSILEMARENFSSADESVGKQHNILVRHPIAVLKQCPATQNG